MHAPDSPSGHVDAWLADYARARLGSVMDREIEAHLMACDRCFAALVAEVVMDAPTNAETTPA